MDSGYLRLILLVLGILFIAGIYLWDRGKHVDSRLFRKQSLRRARRRDRERVEPNAHDSEPEVADEALPEVDSEALFEPLETDSNDQQAQQPLHFSAQPDTGAPAAEAELSFSARTAFQEFEAGAKLPTKIIQVHLLARNSEIRGQMILDLCKELNLQHGEFKIFHRLDPHTGKSIFSLANLVEPGNFDLEQMPDFHTQGLTLFTQLPAPVDSLTAFDEMMDAAKRIRYILGAEMQDATHSVMTAQSIEHERDAVMAYKQQLQLALQSL